MVANCSQLGCTPIHTDTQIAKQRNMRYRPERCWEASGLGRETHKPVVPALSLQLLRSLWFTNSDGMMVNMINFHPRRRTPRRSEEKVEDITMRGFKFLPHLDTLRLTGEYHNSFRMLCPRAWYIPTSPNSFNQNGNASKVNYNPKNGKRNRRGGH